MGKMGESLVLSDETLSFIRCFNDDSNNKHEQRGKCIVLHVEFVKFIKQNNFIPVMMVTNANV